MPFDGHTPGQEHLQDQLRSAQEECERLREENSRLRAMLGLPALAKNRTALHPEPAPEDSTKITGGPSTAEEKIALFRNLFRGREDIYAIRWGGICQHVFILKGGMGAKQRKQVAESLALVSTHEPRMILATGSYFGEGFDDARLDTLFLAMPISWRGTLQQYVGRLHRLHENKKEVLVYDYSDVLVPMLARMYKKRLAGYSALGYVVANGFAD
jgi:uncharacterized protein (UPF0335 family)